MHLSPSKGQLVTNENTEYEKLAQEIYQAISDADGVKNINIQHNIKLPGKSGCNHQIDVYWEFEMMGIKHCVAIECKNYSSEVSVGKVRDFFGVLHTLETQKAFLLRRSDIKVVPRNLPITMESC